MGEWIIRCNAPQRSTGECIGHPSVANRKEDKASGSKDVPDAARGSSTWHMEQGAYFKAIEEQHIAMRRHMEMQHAALCRLIEESRQSLEERVMRLGTELTGTRFSKFSAFNDRFGNFEDPFHLTPNVDVSDMQDVWAREDKLVINETTTATEAECEGGASSSQPKINRAKKRPLRIKTKSSSGLAEHKFNLKKWMRGPFDLIMGIFIACNVLVMFVQLEYEGYLADVVLGQDVKGKWPGAKMVFQVFEHFFNIVFILELAFRLAILRLAYFKEKANILDGTVVVVTTFNTYILAQLNLQGPQNLTFFRMIRFVRIFKALRVVRVMHLFQQLRVLMRAIAVSLLSLLWSLIILLILQVMSAMFLCQTLNEFIVNEEKEFKHRQWANRYYGSSSKALYTMFEVTFSGGWPTYVRPVVEDVNPLLVIFFVIYVAGVVFAIIRIITALFLKETMQVAADDAHRVIQERMEERRAYVEKLRELFLEVDPTGDGIITLQDFEAILRNPLAQGLLRSLDLGMHDIQCLFNMIDDGDGKITYDEFLHGTMRWKVQARSQDVVAVLHDSEKILNQCHKLYKICNAMVQSVDSKTKQASASASTAFNTA